MSGGVSAVQRDALARARHMNGPYSLGGLPHHRLDETFAVGRGPHHVLRINITEELHDETAKQRASGDSESENEFRKFCPVVEDEESLHLLRFYDSFDGAVSAFILTELHIRQADRCKALGVFTDYQKHSANVGAQQN